QVSIMRGYCKYLLQTGVPFSQAYMEQTVASYPEIAGLLVELFEAKFDPRRIDAGAETIELARARLRREMELLTPAKSLADNPGLVDDLIACREQPRETQIRVIMDTIHVLLGRVASLDEDRILRGFMA